MLKDKSMDRHLADTNRTTSKMPEQELIYISSIPELDCRIVGSEEESKFQRPGYVSIS
jgi:hypothetical protein